MRNDMLLLTTKGRRSNRPHTVPLLYLVDGDRWVVIASYGGRDVDPDWLNNIRADPRATVQTGRSRHRVTAGIAGPSERARLWPRVLSAYDGYRAYQARTDREIPLVLLSATPDSA